MYYMVLKLQRQRQIADGLGQFWIGFSKLGNCLDPVPVSIGALGCHLLGAEAAGGRWVEVERSLNLAASIECVSALRLRQYGSTRVQDCHR